MSGGMTVSGVVKQGLLQAGDKVVVLPSGQACTVKSTLREKWRNKKSEREREKKKEKREKKERRKKEIKRVAERLTQSQGRMVMET